MEVDATAQLTTISSYGDFPGGPVVNNPPFQ